MMVVRPVFSKSNGEIIFLLRAGFLKNRNEDHQAVKKFLHHAAKIE